MKGRQLQRIKAAPGNAHHAPVARGPGLCANPLHDGDGIVPFLLGVFVIHESVAVAVAAHVDADAGIPVASKVGMCQFIARDCAITFAVGEMLQNRGNRVFLSILRQPDPRRQLHPVGHHDALVRPFDNLARKICAMFQVGPSQVTE